MSANGRRNFYNLNQDNLWPGFQRKGIEIRSDGALQLASVPLLSESQPPDIATLPNNTAPAGLAVAEDGSIYYSQPDKHRVMWIESCAGKEQSLPCIDGQGKRPSQFREPRALLLHPQRPALLVADSANHRLQLFHPRTFQLLGIWGSQGTEPGQFDQPWDMSADANGNVYVVDAGQNKRVQKFDFRGNVQPAFAQRVADSGALNRPVGVAVSDLDGAAHVFVIDVEPPGLVIFDARGTLIERYEYDLIREPLAVEVAGSTVYIGDNELRCIHVLRWTEETSKYLYVGRAQNYDGPVAALVADGDTLWLLPGGASAPLPLAMNQGHIKRALIFAGPFSHQERAVHWHRLQALGADQSGGATIQYFVYTSDELGPPEPVLAQDTPFAAAEWQRLPIGVTEALVPGYRLEPNETHDLLQNFLPARYLWLGILFNGNGRESTALKQLRLEFDQATYRQYLPAIFSKGRDQRELWDRFLALFESFFTEAELKIEELSHYFDPGAVPAAWLPWLATWVALELDENWSEEQKRQAIASEMSRSARRGTSSGLQEALYRHGVLARIEEPHVQANWWMLPDGDAELDAGSSNLLGVGTMLVPAQADGAIAGHTAALDRSHLISGEDYGAPLFTGTAYQFSVQIYRGQAEKTGLLNRARAIIEEEMPAHTAYHLCLIEPRLRIGYQARLGIDTIVGGPAQPSRLGQKSSETAVRLGGDLPGQLGSEGQIGQTTRLAA